MIAVLLASLTLLIAARAALSADRAFLVTTLSIAWLAFLILLAVTNDAIPFAGGGDDEVYFDLARTPIGSLSDIFDTTNYISLDQPGYAMILTGLSGLSGHNLFQLKAFNLSLFLLLAIVWYLIGRTLESQSFGRLTFLTVVMLTPLWFYFFFLLKDIVIAFLQSLFLLGLVNAARRNAFVPWVLMAAATIAVLPFRTGAALINVAILGSFTMLRRVGTTRSRGTTLSLVLAGAFVAGIVILAGNAQFLESFGVIAKHRVLGSEEMFQGLKERRETSEMDRALFPLLYLLSETAGLGSKSWERYELNLASWRLSRSLDFSSRSVFRGRIEVAYASHGSVPAQQGSDWAIAGESTSCFPLGSVSLVHCGVYPGFLAGW